MIIIITPSAICQRKCGGLNGGVKFTWHVECFLKLTALTSCTPSSILQPLRKCYMICGHPKSPLLTPWKIRGRFIQTSVTFQLHRFPSQSLEDFFHKARGNTSYTYIHDTSPVLVLFHFLWFLWCSLCTKFAWKANYNNLGFPFHQAILVRWSLWGVLSIDRQYRTELNR